MLNDAKVLSQSALHSALGGQSMIRPNQMRARRTLTASLMLTSLVDAFSILVIFLIMNNATSSEQLNIGHKVTLPQAGESQLIHEGIVVRVEEGKFVIEDKPVAQGSLIATLKALNAASEGAKKEGLIIVADRNLDYNDLSPVILAGSQSGFTKFKFAVTRKD